MFYQVLDRRRIRNSPRFVDATGRRWHDRNAAILPRWRAEHRCSHARTSAIIVVAILPLLLLLLLLRAFSSAAARLLLSLRTAFLFHLLHPPGLLSSSSLASRAGKSRPTSSAEFGGGYGLLVGRLESRVRYTTLVDENQMGERHVRVQYLDECQTSQCVPSNRHRVRQSQEQGWRLLARRRTRAA